MLKTVKKAVAAFFAAGLGSLGTAVLDGSLTSPEALVAMGVGLVAAAAVYKLKNADPDPV